MEINELINKLREIAQELEAHAVNPPNSCVGKLCWVSDDNQEDKGYAETVTSYEAQNSFPYGTRFGATYRYATPVKPDELG